jgi:plastocyanin
MFRRSLFALALATLVVGGCDQKKNEGAQPAAAPAAPSPASATPASGAAAAPAAGTAANIVSGDTGTIRGHVKIIGKIPVMEDLKRNSDAFCATKHMKDETIIADGKGDLANAVVHVNGLPPTAPPAEKATLAQDDCMYRPRVQAIVAGQTLDIKNGDPVLHNVHTYKGASTLFNVAQVPGTPNIEKTFSDNGAMLKFKCDVHQWMTGYVWVQNNRYFAVTGKDGDFEIKDVPVGTWEIQAWHERLGDKTAKVTVQKGKTADVDFTFDANAPTSK